MKISRDKDCQNEHFKEREPCQVKYFRPVPQKYCTTLLYHLLSSGSFLYSPSFLYAIFHKHNSETRLYDVTHPCG